MKSVVNVIVNKLSVVMTLHHLTHLVGQDQKHYQVIILVIVVSEVEK